MDQSPSTTPDQAQPQQTTESPTSPQPSDEQPRVCEDKPRVRAPTFLRMTQNYSFEKFGVPPRHYSGFLTEASRILLDELVRRNGCASWKELDRRCRDEAARSEAASKKLHTDLGVLDRYQPAKSHPAPGHISLDATMTYTKSQAEQASGVIYRSNEYIQRFFMDEPIALANPGPAIKGFLKMWDDHLRTTYPHPERTLPHTSVDTPANARITDRLHAYSLRLGFSGHTTNGHYDVDLNLHDSGYCGPGPDNRGIIPPGLTIQIQGLFLTQAQVEETIGSLDTLVKARYKVNVGGTGTYSAH